MDILDKIDKGDITGYLTIKRRIIFSGGVYHVTQRAPGRELLFLEDSDYLYCLKLLKETVAKFQLDLFTFCLLPNHLHILVKINSENLSQAMKNLFERYADYFNMKYMRRGHVFCGRYRASLCNDDNYILAVSSYIHLNPFKAGICEDFLEYRWSSIKLYIRRIAEHKKSFVNSGYILSMIDLDFEKARGMYIEFLQDGMQIQAEKWADKNTVKDMIRKAAKNARKILCAQNQDRVKELDREIENFKSKKKVITQEDSKARNYLVQQLLANGLSAKEIMHELTISKSTYYRIYRESKRAVKKGRDHT